MEGCGQAVFKAPIENAVSYADEYRNFSERGL